MTPRLAIADVKDRWRAAGETRLPGAGARLGVLVAALAVGVALGILSLSWVGTWHQFGHHLFPPFGPG